LIGSLVSGRYEGDITNLLFDLAFVQDMIITGHITRTFTDATPTQVEFFQIKGVYNGTIVKFSVDYTGDDTELEFSVNGGQFKFSYLNVASTDAVTIKYSAKVKIDDAFFA